MLQAITRNKAEKFLKQDGKRIPREDLMTDVVFGGLRYFEPDQGGIALHWLMPEVVELGSLLLEIRLWPRRNRCEPDVVVDMEAPNGASYRVIIECKWLDFMLTAKQLDEQWAQFGPNSPETTGEVRHVLVVQRKARVEPEAFISASREMRVVRTLLLWRDLAASASSRSRAQGSVPLNRWIMDVVHVLDAADEKAFSGWGAFPDVDMSRDKQFLFQSQFWEDPDLLLAIDPLAEIHGWYNDCRP